MSKLGPIQESRRQSEFLHVHGTSEFDAREDRQPVITRPRNKTKTLRLDSESELKIEMQSRLNQKRQVQKQRTNMFGNFYTNVLGAGSSGKKKDDDVQQQIEKYVENLCQIYSKGTGGRADSQIEEKFVIYPDSSFRIYWDLCMLCLIVWSALYVPFGLTFGVMFEVGKGGFLLGFGWFVDIMFIIDVILNFMTAYKDGAIVVTDTKKITRRYLTHWFIIDFLASLPLEKFSGQEGTDVNRLLRLLRVFKLFRLARLLRYSNTLRDAVHIQPSVVRLIQQMVGVLWVWHVLACGYWSMSEDNLGDPDDTEGSWTPEDVTGTNQDHWEHYYVQSYLWAVETTFSFKLHHKANTTGQGIYSIIVIVLGIIMSAIVIGTAASALSSMDAEAIDRRRALDKVVRYMKRRKLPAYFQRIIVDFHTYMLEKPSQDELMDGLPEPIKLRLSLLLNRDLVKDIPMLKQLPIGPIIGLMQKLNSEIYLPGEFAITAGDVGGFMHFVRSGELDLLLDDNATIVQSLNEGDIFGHIAVIENAPHSHSVRAVKYSEVTSLERKSYMNIVNESEKFEEMITMEAIRQENLIAAAKKNVLRFGKLARMGGSASTEHNDRGRRTSKHASEESKASPKATVTSPKATQRGARATIVQKVQAFIKEPDRAVETKKEKRERSVREEARSMRRSMSISSARIAADLNIDDVVERASSKISGTH
ncbi:hypothetical protein TrRE_jg6306 [Triparma retinervis]|uniref:Cyclic nucleotide-binding domain-containing protein n=1 Tax=Triparma retinervis TaxID=2557542 RepID=A0A9W6ZI88_9STRA|nr:hypothetical protein TrRE_jg6306 [Triparma retinervis]